MPTQALATASSGMWEMVSYFVHISTNVQMTTLALLQNKEDSTRIPHPDLNAVVAKVSHQEHISSRMDVVP